MSSEERKAYKVIFDGLRMRSYNIFVPLNLGLNDIQEIYLRVLYDNPLFYYVNQTVIRTQGQIGAWSLLPEYLYSNSEIKRINKDIRAVIDKVKVKADSFKNNEFRLEKCLHDSVVKSVAYDYDSLKRSDCFNAHSVVGCFLDNKAVCEGIAKAFKLLCNEYDIKCIVVLGKANKDGTYSNDDLHAWNLVKIGDESYHVDVTWDNMYDEEFRHISYDYFNVTTKDILLDHQPFGKLPECTATRLNYFYCTKSFVSSYSELTELITRRFSSKEIMFKALKDKGEFLGIDELKEKTITAILHAMFLNASYKPFALDFNEMHNIGKIIFKPKTRKKIDLKKHIK